MPSGKPTDETERKDWQRIGTERRAQARRCPVCLRGGAIKTTTVYADPHGKRRTVAWVRECRWCGYKTEKDATTGAVQVLNPGAPRPTKERR